ncbi:MAG: heavy-metal-associated domain-containing protein [Segetibacter sp.]
MLCLIFTGTISYSQDNKMAARDTAISFKVFGVCEQCKNRIEEALKVKGIVSADWNIDTKILALTYNPARISLDKIHSKITAAGHDTYQKRQMMQCIMNYHPAVIIEK